MILKMENTKIKVKTIGYYHRDKNMRVIPDLKPRKLNGNRKYIDNQTEKLCVPLDIIVDDAGAGEHFMESLFEYISLKPWKQEDKPDFVTNKNSLKFITSGDFDDQIEVYVVKTGGVIFMIKKSVERDMGPNFGAEFEHFLTKTAENEKISEDGTVRKAVFTAEVPVEMAGGEKKFKVMYSGEIDAIGEEGENVALKVQWKGMNYIFWQRSCYLYWQAVFGNCSTVIVGSRTGDQRDRLTKAPDYIAENSLYKIKSLPTHEIPNRMLEASKNKPYWTVEGTERQIKNFLSNVYETVRNDGDCFVFSKFGKNGQWKVENDRETMEPFYKLVKKCMGREEAVKSNTDPVPTSIILPPVASSPSQPKPAIVSNPPNPPATNDQDKPAADPTNTTNTAPLEPLLPVSKPIPTSTTLQNYINSITISPLTIPGLLQTIPKFKIVFNAPYDEKLTNRLKLINPSGYRIGFEVKIKSTDQQRISIDPQFGLLNPKDSISLKVSCEAFDFEEQLSQDRVIVEWKNIPNDGEFELKMMEGDGLFQRKTLKIEYND